MPLPSRATSHARGHLRVSRFARRTTEKRETARSLSFCVVYAVHGVFYTLTEQIFFASLSLTFRGYEAGLFHAY